MPMTRSRRGLPREHRRYLWPGDVGAPQRLRDLAVLERRLARLDIVLSRKHADAL